jgi:alkylated DNA repair dioxygenase AlkB
MDSLFPLEAKFPAGFSYTSEFISTAEEENLLEQISRIQLHTFLFQGFEAKRKVASFGYDYSFDRKVLTKGKDIPEGFQWLIDKVNRYLTNNYEFSELLVTQYPVGSVINWHRDAPPFDSIVGISLLSDCFFRFRPHDKAKQGRKKIVTCGLARRSLYIMQGASRSEWEHSILPVKEERYSITLRTLRNSPPKGIKLV